MTKNTKTVSPFIDSSRTRARSIQARQSELGSPVTLAQAYELLAAADGFRTWAAMRAAGENVSDKDTRPPEGFDPYATVVMKRRISLDAFDAASGDDIPALLKAAYAELSYHFFDGEESLSMQFRDVDLHPDRDEYLVSVDVEIPPGVTDLNAFIGYCMKKASKDNVLLWAPGPDVYARNHVEAVFPGSGVRKRNLPWTVTAANSSARP